MEETVPKEQVKLTVEGMTCTNCATGISRFLERKGMEDVSVNFATAEARFKMEKGQDLATIKKGIEKLGYHVAHEHLSTEKKGWPLKWKFIFALVFTLPLLLHMVVHIHVLMNPYLQLALSLPVMVLGFIHFGKSALGSIRAGVANMDVLIILGSSAAFLYSLYGTFVLNGDPNYLFYETAATIITLILLGNLIEQRSVKQTTTAIRELSQLQPSVAKKVSADGEQTTEVPVASIKKDDILLVNTGDRVPLDGIVVWGDATVDESMVTGESLPMEKSIKDKVVGGTILNSGSIKMQVTATGDDTFLARIIELVKSAQQKKPEIQQLADRVSTIFVPAVIAIAVLASVLAYFVFHTDITSALMRGIAVLAIACPCAMGLATPTAVMVGIGRVSKEGILIKGGRTLEQLSTIKQVVFDKTGTLTTGHFKISKLNTYKNDAEEVKTILYNMEQHSSHPLAVSIIKELEGRPKIAWKTIHEIKGVGVKGEDEAGNIYEAGSYQIARNHTTDNQFDIYLVKNGELMAALQIEDELKPEAKETIDFLKSKGIRPVILSGDRYEKVAKTAHILGVETFYAERKPEQKLELIEQLSDQTPTAMVGDGINDAPALARATLGISMGNATEIAINTAQVILVKGDLSLLKEAIGISKGTISTIKQNLFWAFSYNIIAIPIAALGFLNPMVAALSMAFSDVVVVGNSLRLKARKLN